MGLLTYSGIATKVRAMKSRLLTDKQFLEMASLKDVHSAADYLKQQTAYAEIFSTLDDSMLHRGHIEQLLTQSEYQDFAKLYRFSNLKQRKFLNLYFMHYEITMLKRLLRHVISHQKITLDLSAFQDFFEKHSCLDLESLSRAESLQDFVALLRGSHYYHLLNPITHRGGVKLFDYELQLDLYYFNSVWKTKSNILSKEEQQVLSECFGCRVDLLNIQWIYRAKQYYSMSPPEIYALLIPIHYRLNATQIHQLIKAETTGDFFNALGKTFYGRMEPTELNRKPDVETLYHQILNRIYNGASRKHPYSAAILDSYLYFKELETRKIITILEGIRYGLSSGEIQALTAKQ